MDIKSELDFLDISCTSVTLIVVRDDHGHPFTVPEDTDMEAVKRVIAVHVPKPPQPSPDQLLQYAIDEAKTLEELKKSLSGNVEAKP